MNLQLTANKLRILSTAALLAALSFIAIPSAAQDTAKTAKEAPGKVKLMTLDPGHFHASLVQKFMLDSIDPVVNVYAPGGTDLEEHLKRIQTFNTRADKPTKWEEKIHTGPDFFQKMLEEKPGNVVVISGNNARKTEYITGCINAGLNVLADKPMAITPEGYDQLVKAFATAKEKNVLLYDIMTERHEITTMMQRELSMMPEIFGTLQKGTPENPAVTKESVHHFCKVVAGAALKRPAWYYDTAQQGEAIVDVTTHLVDLIQWECFPGQTLNTDDVKILSARRWATKITPEQFKKSTGVDQFPDYLKKDLKDGVLNAYANGEFVYTLKGVNAKVSVTWNFEPPVGGGDLHYSMMHGTKADLIIKQGKEQKFVPTLYVENTSGADDAAFEKTLKAGVETIDKTWPGIEVKKLEKGWEIAIPDKYRVGHESHFSQVTEQFLKYLAAGALPEWEVPNMITKYYTTTQAYKASR